MQQGQCPDCGTSIESIGDDVELVDTTIEEHMNPDVGMWACVDCGTVIGFSSL